MHLLPAFPGTAWQNSMEWVQREKFKARDAVESDQDYLQRKMDEESKSRFWNDLNIGKMLVPSSICCSLTPDRFDQSWRVAFLKFPFDLSLVMFSLCFFMFSQSTVAGWHVWSVCDWGRIAAKDQYLWLVDELMSPTFDIIWCRGIQ